MSSNGTIRFSIVGLFLVTSCALSHRARDEQDAARVDVDVVGIDRAAIADDGAPLPDGDDTVVIDAPPACVSPNMMCGAECVDVSVDTSHCGNCETACIAGQTCASGACAGCATGLTGCRGNCVDLTNDAMNCGACAHECGAGTCAGGVCLCTTPAIDCSGTCLDVSADNANCGSCGHVCASSHTCVDGTCACPSGTEDCGGSCVDLDTDAANCGTCGHDCGPASCSGGACQCGPLTDCASGCTSTALDRMNCGSCGHACSGAESCWGGTCDCRAPAVRCRSSCIIGVCQ